MPTGQSFTTWFPELKNMLKSSWNFESSIQDHFALVEKLNKELTQTRIKYKVKPPTFYCRHCKERHEMKMNMVTITAMYFALERFGLCSHQEHLELKRTWKQYSKWNLIDINGNSMIEEIEKENRMITKH